jgi:pyruvate, orthophosphate dikinase
MEVYCNRKLNLYSSFSVLWQFFTPTVAIRQKALDRSLPYQKSDFEAIFRTMDGM